MSYTRAQFEEILIQRCHNLMEAAGMAVFQSIGFHAALNDPIGYALRRLGYSVADIGSVADADVTAVTSSDVDAALDLAELRLLQNILGNLDGVDITVGPRQERLSQLRDGVEMRIGKLAEQIAADHGIGGASLQAGTIDLDFADHNEDVITE